MDPETDMIFSRDKQNNITSGGYKIDNIFKKMDLPPIHGSILNQKGGGKHFAVPMGLFFLQQGLSNIQHPVRKKTNISDDLFSKLLKYSQNQMGKRFNYTRKKRKTSKRRTRRRM